MKITTVGLDLAKNVFQVHGIDEQGKIALKRQLQRDQVAPFFVNLPPCLIGMEACGSAHHWARKLHAMGHIVRLMAQQFVKPYVKTNKNDAADAEAICEAVFGPTCDSCRSRTSISRRFWLCTGHDRASSRREPRRPISFAACSVSSAFGYIAKRVPELIEDASYELPGVFRILVQRLLDHLKELDRQVGELESQIQAWHRASELSSRLAQVPGIGPITATAPAR